MKPFQSNLKTLRKYKKASQATLAEALSLTRSSLSAYENGTVEPNIATLLRMADYFRVSLDRLLRQDMSVLTEFELRKIEQGHDQDIHGRNLRILATTVDKNNQDQVEVVPAEARAGYTAGYSDVDFISDLPRIQLHNLPSDRKYRVFPIIGDSMPPVSEGSFVIGEYIEDFTSVKDGTPCIVVTADEGIVFKLVTNRIDQSRSFLLASTNPTYKPYEVDAKQVLEIWQFKQYLSDDLPEPNLGENHIAQALLQIQQDLATLKERK